ncbi:MAG: KpsF/GutQ family sugar-phosphate isomerase [Fimbriimonadaceae bacterium]|nr:KpsF/GutQ family sugar-phosphate isomerase [Fimbriimonadaceae bacterium]
MSKDADALISCARRVLALEAEAVAGVANVLDDRFLQTIELLLNCRGRVITSGMGKAGLIARKIAATLASTGTPSFFMHPGEGVHGDLGMITGDDVVVALSHRGQTEEVLRIIPYLKHFQTSLVAITSNPDSELAKSADVALLLDVKEEACPMNLAPTSSTTAMLALGDAIAITLLEARGFGPEDYALRHPGGSLGRRLLTKVGDIMHTGDDNPVVREDAALREAILVMTRSKLAATSVVDSEGNLVGFFTDGDLRRYLMGGEVNLDVPIALLMTQNPKHAWPDMMAAKALEILRQYKIIELPVCDERHRPVGMIHLHDITRAGIT